MYFTPDGQSAIVVAEESQRLDFRDPHTMALQWSLPTPGCAGINHADFSIDGRYALFTCEYAGGIAKIDLVKREVVGYLKKRGIGILITDHNVRETLDIIDRASIIHAGEVLFEGSPEQIVDDPEVRRVYLGDRFN